MNEPLKTCSECNGDGYIRDLVCCGRGKMECCGDPDIREIDCHQCLEKMIKVNNE